MEKVKSFFVMFLIIGLLFFVPEIKFASDENSSEGSMDNSSANSGENSSGESGDVSGSSLLIGAVVIVGGVIWSGISTTKAVIKKKKQKEDKEIATAVFSEATNGYGNKTNISILARYYGCSCEHVIDVISKLSLEGYIDINKSLIDNQTAGNSLAVLNNELLKEAERKGVSKNNKEKLLTFSQNLSIVF